MDWFDRIVIAASSFWEMELGLWLCGQMAELAGSGHMPETEARQNIWLQHSAALVGAAILSFGKMQGIRMTAFCLGIVIAGVSAFSWFVWRRPVGNTALWMVLYVTVMFSIDLVLVGVLSFLMRENQMGTLPFFNLTWFRLICLLILRPFYTVGLCHMLRRKLPIFSYLRGNKIVWWGASLIGVAFLVPMRRIQEAHIYTQFLETWFNYAIAVVVLWGCAFLWGAYQNARREQERMRQEQAYLRLTFEGCEEENEAYRRYLHDEKKHLQVLQGLLAADEAARAQEYLAELSGRAQRVSRTRWTGNTTMNLLLSLKSAEAQEQGIRMTIRAAFFSCHVKDGDLCVLLGNLMDNAIEACGYVTKQEKWITVDLEKQGAYLYMTVANAMERLPRQKNGAYLSAKRDFQTSGCGLALVEETARSYDGTLMISQEDGTFRAEVVLKDYNGEP